VFKFDPANFQLEDLDRIIDQSQEAMRNLAQVQDALGEVTGEGTGADGMVAAIVNGTGGIQQVTFNPRIMRLDSQRLAEEVTAAVRAAQQDAQRKTNRLLGGALGDAESVTEPLNQDKIREQLESIQESFGRKMDDRTDEFVRRSRER
jgi:DNA-binding protein YbaB